MLSVGAGPKSFVTVRCAVLLSVPLFPKSVHTVHHNEGEKQSGSLSLDKLLYLCSQVYRYVSPGPPTRPSQIGYIYFDFGRFPFEFVAPKCRITTKSNSRIRKCLSVVSKLVSPAVQLVRMTLQPLHSSNTYKTFFFLPRDF